MIHYRENANDLLEKERSFDTALIDHKTDNILVKAPIDAFGWFEEIQIGRHTWCVVDKWVHTPDEDKEFFAEHELVLIVRYPYRFARGMDYMFDALRGTVSEQVFPVDIPLVVDASNLVKLGWLLCLKNIEKVVEDFINQEFKENE